MSVFMTWNLHDWSRRRESKTAALPTLVRVLQEHSVDVAFLSEVQDAEGLMQLLDFAGYHMSWSKQLCYKPDFTVDHRLPTEEEMRAIGCSPYVEHYFWLTKKSLNVAVTDHFGTYHSVNPPPNGQRVGLRSGDAEPFIFEEDRIYCTVYRPAWQMTLSCNGQYLNVLGVHTKPIGSKDSSFLISTMSQTEQAVLVARKLSSPWLVCGDFYADPAALAGKLGCDVRAPAQTTNYTRGTPCVADYFIAGPGLEGTSKAERIDISTYPHSDKAVRYSDHDAVKVELPWPQPEGSCSIL